MELVRNLVFIFAFGFVQLVLCNEGAGPIFQTNFGKIQGSIMKTDKGIDFFAFRGIPFAKPPVKELRFKEPQPLTEQWEGVLDATEESTICIQYELVFKYFTGDEDCLYLNVYTPKTEGQAFGDPLPVMVWIHGGAFFSGSGASSVYGPQRFMDKSGIILVTINYRLGPFGFLTTLDENSPGNYGMLDQVMALKWVKDNIAAFGGDPNQVTIFGESAGSASVGFHLISPLSKGYFHAAIAQSGSVLSDWATRYDTNQALKDGKTLAADLNCPTNDHKAMMKCLTRLPSLDIIVKTANLMAQHLHDTCNLVVFQPVVDISRGSGAFLPDRPLNLVVNKQYNSVPIITGSTKDEGVLLLDFCAERHGGVSSIPKSKLAEVLHNYDQELFKNEEQWKRVSQELMSPYFQEIDEADISKKTDALNNLFTDNLITFKIDLLNDLLVKNDVPVYVYKFIYRGEHSIFENAPNYMVSHADELQYIFRCGYFKSTKLSDEDVRMSDIILTLWTNFAKTKKPSLEGSLSDQPGFVWEPMTSINKPKYLDLDTTPTMVSGHLSFNYNLWKNAHSSINKDEL